MYANDFGEMRASSVIGSKGVDDSGQFRLGGSAAVQVYFAPGRGTEVEGLIADTIAGTSDRLYIASMVISSGKILRSIGHGMLDVCEFGGIYDGGSMAGVEVPWKKAKAAGSATSPSKAGLDALSSAEALSMWTRLQPHLVSKHSYKYNDDLPHNFMHDKVAVADDNVTTGVSLSRTTP